MATKFSLVRSNYRFTDHEFNAPSGVTITFQRDDGTIPTVDPSGSAVAEEDPRFDHPVLIPSIKSPENALQASGSPSNPDGHLLASGVDADGATPLMCWIHHDYANGFKLYTFVGGSMPSTWPPPSPPTPTSPHVTKTLTARSADRIMGPGPDPYGFYELFSDSQNYTINGKRKAFRIRDGCIFHGAIILAGKMYLQEEDSPTALYVVRGWGFAISIDRGASWQLFFDDIHDPATTEDQRGRPRGAGYCIRLAPIYQRAQDLPSECYFSCSDYRESLAGVSGYGRVYFSKITRDVSDDPPGPWTTHDVKVFEVGQTLTHVHTAQVTEFGEEEPGLQMVASIGDGADHNRFIRYVLPDITDDYMDEGNWLVEDQFHGTYAAGGQPGSFSGQPAGVCFGPEPGSIIWSSDTTHDWLNMMVLPMNLEEQLVQAQFKHIYGLPQCGGDEGALDNWQPVVSTIKDVRPELAGGDNAPAVAIFVPEPTGGSVAPVIRLLYTPAVSGTVDTWTQVAAIRDGACSTVVYGDFIYWNHSINNIGFKKVPVPETLSLEPVLVACGGTNLAKSGSVYAPFSGLDASVVVTAIAPSGGHYYDGSVQLPDPPCFPARVFRIETSRGATDPTGRPASAGKINVSSDGTTMLAWNRGSPFGSVLVRRWRAWILDRTYGQMNPNKTTQLGVSTSDYPGGDPTPRQATGARYSCSDRWCPIRAIGGRPITDLPYAFPLDLIGSHTGTDPDDNRVFLAVAEALDGQGALSYPLTPTTGSSPATREDEHLEVEGLGLSCATSWQLRVAGMHPAGNWDHFAVRGTYNAQAQLSSARKWPLFHLLAGDGSYIEFVANCEGRGFIIRYRSGSSGGATEVAFASDLHYWIADAPLFVAIAFDSTSGSRKVIVGASLGGDQVRTHSMNDPFSQTTPPTFNELQFQAGPGAAIPGEVVEFRWFGGDFENAMGFHPTEATVQGAFESLAFLSPD